MGTWGRCFGFWVNYEHNLYFCISLISNMSKDLLPSIPFPALKYFPMCFGRGTAVTFSAWCLLWKKWVYYHVHWSQVHTIGLPQTTAIGNQARTLYYSISKHERCLENEKHPGQKRHGTVTMVSGTSRGKNTVRMEIKKTETKHCFNLWVILLHLPTHPHRAI